jgi:hypothetical protein
MPNGQVDDGAAQRERARLGAPARDSLPHPRDVACQDAVPEAVDLLAGRKDGLSLEAGDEAVHGCRISRVWNDRRLRLSKTLRHLAVESRAGLRNH